ncbi:endocuticle structural glycoprotein SgAbd-2-like [Nilaparvata lugens]|uniref:Cuticular protein n=1 Tax=Nilaparvata lugens TaxID=108931 RepID=A0A2S1ZS69_NILLU|nr:endocuticle structural glycoprotein SgAbd-2-like [Nilaparvata lugens]AWK28301.1 cuticular protein [Nilaparvata lugens]
MYTLTILATVVCAVYAQTPIYPGAPGPIPAAAPIYAPKQIAPQQQYPYYSILRQSNDVGFDGSFSYGYETENGISESVSGVLKNPGTEVEAQEVHGSYSYTAPDGTPITVNWVADENGFRAEGAHIPQASPEIQRSIAYNLANAAPVQPVGPGIARPVVGPSPAPFRYPTPIPQRR